MRTLKSRRVLDLDGGPDLEDAVVYFVARDDDNDHVTTEVMLTVADWCDLGQPSKVTVTVEPGDLLNPPKESPHSRACHILDHPHGPRCSTNCPTCGGRA